MEAKVRCHRCEGFPRLSFACLLRFHSAQARAPRQVRGRNRHGLLARFRGGRDGGKAGGRENESDDWDRHPAWVKGGLRTGIVVVLTYAASTLLNTALPDAYKLAKRLPETEDIVLEGGSSEGKQLDVAVREVREEILGSQTRPSLREEMNNQLSQLSQRIDRTDNQLSQRIEGTNKQLSQLSQRISVLIGFTIICVLLLLARSFYKVQ